ncbi:MAG: acyl-CoA thioesterase [Sphingomonas sp.]|uniref:acyl-CoA thioesterase n=1 Tax=unclassified Sphingomonas TaxID=196159 RepID=UPI002458EDFF|nr:MULTISPECIES: thioesterase family protein [unclassified Sphingomonas]MBQ1498880.1 acyl-CoA thioesterase [Sphingomonas sp.]MDH4746021.1 acyl-CoA thioesterase [Sphingomonas sp. CBMAI 2297]
MNPSNPHHYAIRIEAADIDALGHVNNAIYLRWVQAAVVDHWERLAPPEAVAAHRWVAVRHDITYRKPAFLADALIATVVLECVRRESAFYGTVIRRGTETLAEVKSRWCCLDAATLQPARLAASTVACFLPPAEMAIAP